MYIFVPQRSLNDIKCDFVFEVVLNYTTLRFMAIMFLRFLDIFFVIDIHIAANNRTV